MNSKIIIAAVFVLAMGLGGCASKETESDADVAQATADPTALDQPSPSDKPAPAPGETTEADLAAQEPQSPPPPTAPVAEQPPPPAPETPPAIVDNGPPAVVTGLDYKANVNGGTMVLRTDKPVQYTTRKNTQSNQFVVELKNTDVPKRFRQPYTTKEFGGAIGSINAYQAKGAPHTTRVVIQLRDAVEPGVAQDGNIISVAGSGGSPEAPKNTTQANQQAPPPQDMAAEDDENGDNTAAVNGSKETDVLNQQSKSSYMGDGNKFYGRPISLELKDADIRDVFRFISEESGLNIVVGDDVVGRVTLKLRRIPWDQALQVVLQTKQLGYVKQGNILRISPLATIQKETDAQKNVQDAQKALQPLHVQIFPISYAKAEDLEAQARDFLSPRGKAHADHRTNDLVVTDIDEILTKIKTLIERLDTQTPQVLIEARIIEARETFSRLVGVNWGFNGSPSQTGTNALGNTVNFTPNFQSTPSDPTQAGNLAMGFTLGTLDVFGDLSATLKLLENEQIVKVLSAPRIVTTDRQSASIQQTTQFPVFASQIGATGVATPTVTFQDVRLSLQVTPQITMDGSVIMDVDVIREFPDAPVTIGAQQARAINRREAKTQVLVENGDTVVIGGIYQSDASEGEVGIPWLRKIPLLGTLFKSRNTERTKNELVIFLTPRTLNREKAFGVKGDAG